jgi:hypothetical protein
MKQKLRKLQKEDWLSFLKRVAVHDPKTGCMNWPKTKLWGYGIVRYERHNMGVHRLMFRLTNPGSLHGDLQVNHRCDNRACYNPEHLYAGTQLENVNDMRARGRAVYVNGERNNSKLRETDIPVIRARVAAGEKPYSVAKDYGVDARVIGRIAKREKWRHVP